MPDMLLSDAASETVLEDRRRPGRVTVDEALIPMLRNPAVSGDCSSEPHAEEYVGHGDEVFVHVPLRTLALSIAASMGMWGVMLAGLVVMLR